MVADVVSYPRPFLAAALDNNIVAARHVRIAAVTARAAGSNELAARERASERPRRGVALSRPAAGETCLRYIRVDVVRRRRAGDATSFHLISAAISRRRRVTTIRHSSRVGEDRKRYMQCA